MASAPRPARICAQRQHLSDEALEALRVFTNLQTLHTAALIDDRPNISGIEVALGDARRKWHEAKQAYQKHLDDHGC